MHNGGFKQYLLFFHKTNTPRIISLSFLQLNLDIQEAFRILTT